MRKFFAAQLICAALAAATAAQDTSVTGYVEIEGTVARDERSDRQITVYAHKKLKGKWGAYLFGMTTETYSQAYGGLTYSPKPWIEVSAGAGVEQHRKHWRVAGSVWVGKGKVANLLIYEQGGSGRWYHNQFSVAVTEGVRATLTAERFLGVGPGIEAKLIRNLTAYGGAYRDFESNKTRFSGGLRLSF